MKLRKLASKALATFYTDIFTAAWNGDAALVSQFLQGDARLALATDVSEFGDGWTALHYAAYQGHVDIVEKLLETTSSKSKLVDKQNSIGFTPLFYAAQRDHMAVVKLLLANGANPALFGVPYPEEQPQLFLCPADLAVYSTELHPMLKASARCQPPEEVSINKLGQADLDGRTARLEFIIPAEAVSRSSSLPIKSYKIELYQSRSPEGIKQSKTASPSPQSFFYAANVPKTDTSVCLQVEAPWVRSLADVPKGEVEITMRIAAVNALGDSGPMSAPRTVIYHPAPVKPVAAPAPAGTEAEIVAAEAALSTSQAPKEEVSVKSAKSTPIGKSGSKSEIGTSTPRSSESTKKKSNEKVGKEAAASSSKQSGTSASADIPDERTNTNLGFAQIPKITKQSPTKKATPQPKGSPIAVPTQPAIAADNAASLNIQEGEFSFADLIAADERRKNAAQMEPLAAAPKASKPKKQAARPEPTEDAPTAEGEFSFADLIAADERRKNAGSAGKAAPMKVMEGEFSFADMIDQSNSIAGTGAAPGVAPAPARGGRTYRKAL
jgi:hypothetical protein